MKKKLKMVFLVILILSLGGLAWVNTGNHVESGYTFCEGGGFISQQELAASAGPTGINPGGPCLGEQATKTLGGRYTNTDILNIRLALLAILSIVGYMVALLKLRRAKTPSR